MVDTDTQKGQPGGITSKDVAKGAGTTLLARLGGVVELFTQPLYFWLFGLAGAGFYGAVWAAVNVAENVLDLGMTSAMQRIVPQTKNKAEEASALRAAFLLGVTPCLIAAILVFAFAEGVAGFFNTNDRDAAQAASIIALFVWALPLWAFVEIATSALRSKRVFGAEIRLRLLWEQLTRVVVIVVLYAAGVGTLALFIGHLVSLGVICILSIRLLSRHFDLSLLFKGPVRDAVFRESLKAGLAVLPVNIVTRLFSDGPTIALNAVLPGSAGAVAAGLYVLARKVSSLVQLVRTAFSYVLAPLASAASAGGRDQVRGIYGYATRLSFALAVPMGAVLATSGATVLPLSAPGGEAALFALVVLVTARVIEAVTGAATPIQQVTSRHLDQLWGSVLGMAVAVLIGWFFLKDYGVNAIAVAVGAGLVIAAILPLFQLHVIDKLHPFDAPFGTVVVRASLVAVAGAGVAVLVQMAPILAVRSALVLLVIAIWWRVSVKLALGLALLCIVEYTAEMYSGMPGWLLPYLLKFVLLCCVLVATLWASMRFSLPPEDRTAIGAKTARRLRLV